MDVGNVNPLEKYYSCSLKDTTGESRILRVKVVSKDATKVVDPQRVQEILYSMRRANQLIGSEVTIDLDKTVTFTLLTPKQQDSVRITELSTKALGMRYRNRREVWAEMKKYSGIKILYACLVAPLLFLGKVIDTEPLQRHSKPRGRESLEGAMKDVSEIVSSSPDSASQQLKQAVDEGLTFVTKSKDPDPNVRKSTVRELAIRLCADAEIPAANEPLAAIPGGYWKNATTFEPILWSIYRNTDGRVCIEELAYGQDTGESARVYMFSEQLESEKMEQLLFNLLALSTPPSEVTALCEGAMLGSAYLKLLRERIPQGQTDADPGSANAMPAATFAAYKAGILAAAGAMPVSTPAVAAQKNEQPRVIGEDPFKLVHELIRTQFPEAPLGDKFLFTMHTMTYSIEQRLAHYPDMTLEERQQWQAKLQHDINSLERQMKIAENDAGVGQIFAGFGDHIKLLKKRVDELNREGLTAQKSRMKALDSVQSQRLCIAISPQSSSKLAATASTPPSSITEAEHVKIAALRDAFATVWTEAVDVPATLQTVASNLSELTLKVDQLVEAGDYLAAIELYRLMMPHVPGPTHGFWRMLVKVDPTVDALLERSNRIKGISDDLGKLNHTFWESKVKTGNIKLVPDETVYMLSAKVTLDILLQNRVRVLQQTSENGPVFSQEVLQDPARMEERCFLQAAQGFKNSKEVNDIIKSALGDEQFVRWGENPMLAARVSELRAYLSATPETGEGVSLRDRDRNICRRVLNTHSNIPYDNGSGYIDGEPFTDAENALWLHFLDRDYRTPEGASIPTQLADATRMDVIFTAMLHPDRSVGRTGWLNLFKAGLTKRASGDENNYTLCCQQTAAALAAVSGYRRLEINCRHTSDPDYDSTKGCAWGIVERGSSATPGATAAAEMQLGYETRAHAKITGSGPKTSHENYRSDLGHPKTIEGREDYNAAYQFEQAEADAAFNAEGTSNPKTEFLSRMVFRRRLCNMVNRRDPEGALVAVREFTPIPPFHHVHEVIYQLLAHPELFEDLSKNDQGVEGFEAQKRIYQALFSEGAIDSAISETPDYLISHAHYLHKLLRECTEDPYTARLFPLLYYLDNVKQHVDAKLQKEIKNPTGNPGAEKLREILAVWPNRNSSSGTPVETRTFLSDAIRLMHTEKRTQQRIDAAAYLVSLFRNDLNEFDPQKIRELREDPAVLAALLEAGALLEMAGESMTLPVIGKEARLWVRDHLAPHVDRLPNPLRDDVLDAWVLNGAGHSLTKGKAWERVAGSPMLWQKNGCVVDLASQKILQVPGKPIAGIPAETPSDLAQHPDYRQIFGSATFPGELSLGQSGEMIFTFSDTSGNAYRIAFKKSSSTIDIQREVITKSKNVFTRRTTTSSHWERYYRPQVISGQQTGKGAEVLGFANKIVEAGIWVNPASPNQGEALVRSDPDNLARTELFKINLDNSGHVKSIHTADGLEVVQNPKELEKVLNCLPSDQVYFLRKPGGAAVTEIRFLNQAISLKRSSARKPWILHGDDRLAGATWAMGTDRGSAANQLLKPLGANVEQTGLTVKKGNATHVLLWPQRGVVKSGKSTGITFETEFQTLSPVQIRVTDGERVTASAAGHLHMAYLFSLTHDYSKAANFLTQARTNNRIASKAEIDTILALESHFRAMPVNSARSAAIKLKALLAIRQILQTQTTRPEYQHENWQGFLKSASEIEEVYALYRLHRDKSLLQGKRAYMEGEASEIAFSADEIAQMGLIGEQALGPFCVDLHPQAATPEQLRLEVALPTAQEVEGTLPAILLAMAKPVADPETLLNHLSVSHSCVMEHFFELHELIRTRGLTPDQLLPLFGPMVMDTNASDVAPSSAIGKRLGIDLMPTEKQRVFVATQQLDVARRMLLAAAADNVPKSEPMPAPPAEGEQVVDRSPEPLAVNLPEPEPVSPPPADGHQAIDPLELSFRQHLKAQIPNSKLGALRKAAGLERTNRRLEKLETDKDPQAWTGTDEGQLLARFDLLRNRLTPAPQPSKVITPSGLQAPRPETAKAPPLPGRMLSLDRLREAVANPKTSPFGVEATKQLAEALNKPETRKQLNPIERANAEGEVSEMIPVDRFLVQMSKVISVDLMADLRTEQVRRRIQTLETTIGKRVVVPLLAVDPQVVLTSDQCENRLGAEFRTLFTRPPAEAEVAHLDAMQGSFTNIFSTKKDNPLENAANKDLMDGVNASRQTLVDSLNARKTVTKRDLKPLRAAVTTQITAREAAITSLRGELIKHVQANAADMPLELRQALKQPEAYGEERLLHLLKKNYQMMTLKDDATCTLLTRLLLEQAALGALKGEVMDKLSTLEGLSKQKGIDDRSPEWIAAATRLHDLTSNALDFGRYLLKDPSGGSLKEPSLYRKVLVLEANQGIILTSEQLVLIQEMVEGPPNWHELKVGLGKTSVVIPLVLLMLIERGEFPAAVVKNELMAQNLNSMDGSTRELLEGAGVEFRLNFSEYMTSIMFQEQYLRLLEVQSRGGYPITSNDSLIAIDQRLQQLNDQLVKATEAQMDTFELERSIYYLGKIKEKLNRLIFDEVDDILNVTSENNIAVGSYLTLNTTVQDTMEHLMRIIHENESEEISDLRTKLQTGQQSSLDESQFKTKLLPKLVDAMLQDPKFLKDAGMALLPAKRRQQLVDHICQEGKRGDPVDILDDLTPNQKKILGALKGIVQSKLSPALMQRLDIDVGVKDSDGFQLAPQTLGNERQGTVFGDERELIVNHYLYYGMRLPTPRPGQLEGTSFVERSLRHIQEKHPETFGEWESHAAGDMVAYLNRPENYGPRMQFLRLAIVEESRLRIFPKQIVFNSQDACFGRTVSGMTGTRNLGSLPTTQAEATARAKEVTAQVLLEAGVLGVPVVRVVDQANMLATMQALANDLTYKANINQGHFLEGGDVRAVVAKLREGGTVAKGRTFVYVDSDSGETYLWAPGAKSQPKQISKADLNALALDPEFKKQAFFYFAPTDTRGTDFRIPPGRGDMCLSPRCSMDDFVQALGRLRQSGKTQGMDIHITKAIAKRICARHPGLRESDITYAHVIEDISQQDLQKEQGKALKTALQSMRAVVGMGTRALIYGHHQGLEVPPGYWENAKRRELNRFIVSELTNVANDPVTGWLEEARSLDLLKDFEKTVLEPTSVMTQNQYRIQEARLHRLRQKVEELKATALDERFEEEEVGWYQARLEELTKQLGALDEQLNRAHARIQKQINRGNLPGQVPSSGAAEPSAMSQVQQSQESQQQQQQQVQQSQQMQQQEQHRQVGGARGARSFALFDGPVRYVSTRVTRLFDALPDGDEKDKIQEFWRTNNKVGAGFLDVSLSALRMWKVFNGGLSDPALWRFVIKGNNLTIITREDYHRLKPKDYDAVYSLVGDDLDLVLNRQSTPNTQLPDLHHPDLMAKMVRAKWLLGITTYKKPEEYDLLAAWLKSVAAHGGHKLFMEKYASGQQQRKLLAEILSKP